MSEQKTEYSRVRRKKKNTKANRMLNWMIAIVVLLIIVVGMKIITGSNSPEDTKITAPENNSEENTLLNEDNQENNNQADSNGSEGDSSSDTNSQEKDNEEESIETNNKEGKVTYSASEDAEVDETITNEEWEPIGTKQSGHHVSKYDGNSLDWEEKKEALAYATGMSQNEMTFWRIQNGGSPQKSIGIVSSKDNSKKYRVYLEWVDGKGWKPTQMDVLNTLKVNQ